MKASLFFEREEEEVFFWRDRRSLCLDRIFRGAGDLLLKFAPLSLPTLVRQVLYYALVTTMNCVWIIDPVVVSEDILKA